jgi:hypothetical protein
VDLNSDGYPDILSGSYSRMENPMAGLFQVLWGRADGTFKAASVLNGTDGKPLIIPIKGRGDQTENICTRPTAVDWTGDGNLDLVVGNFAGSFYLFKGEGKGKFNPKPEPILAGKAPLKIEGMHSDPFVIDWDGDGDLDLLSGSNSGGVQWAENVAGKGKPPRFNGFKTLIPPGTEIKPFQLLAEHELSAPADSTRVWVDDVNGDGKLDILVGDRVTLISPAQGVSQEAYSKKLAEWQKAHQAAMKQMESESGRKRMQDLYEQRKEFMNEERTGFVWLYLQR